MRLNKYNLIIKLQCAKEKQIQVEVWKTKENERRNNILSVEVLKIYYTALKCTAVKLHADMVFIPPWRCIINASSSANYNQIAKLVTHENYT